MAELTRDPDLEGLIASWELELRAARKSARTLDTYVKNARAYLKWCTSVAEETPVLSRNQVLGFIVWMQDTDMEAATMRSRLTALKSFAKWCAKEGELPANEVAGITAPKLGEKHRPQVTDEQFAALIGTCDTKTFKGKRDAALLYLMRDCGGRSQELLGLELGEISVSKGHALLHGKGERDRMIPFSPETASAIDRYLRARRTHKLAGSDIVWLGDRNQRFGYSAMWKMITRKAVTAGIAHVHPHMFRRMFADRWLSAGGSVDGLMALAGWKDPSMIRHYAGARANARALDEHQRLFGGR